MLYKELKYNYTYMIIHILLISRVILQMKKNINTADTIKSMAFLQN